MSKKRSLRKHAKRRLVERTGYMMGYERLESFVKMIQAGKADFIDRQSNNKTRWFVPCGEKRIAVVYDKKRKQIVTVLTEDMILERMGGKR